MMFTPTEEQAHAVALAKTGGDLAVEALAGAGKTSTLKLIAEALPGTGAYIAFNRKIVDDGRATFPPSVVCSTAHSLAMRAVGKRFRHRLDSNRMTPQQMTTALGLDPRTPVVFSGDVETIELPSVLVAGVAKRTVDEFCRTADRSIGRRHVPFQRGLDAPNKYDNNRALADMVVPLAEQMWRDLYSIDGRHRFEHNHYLKIWQLEGPRIQADYILFDESQDANSLMLAIVEAQDHAQKIWVGDSNQSIYEWNGAVDALKSVEVSNRAVLSQSFRFGPEIAAAANLVLDRLGAGVQITGSGKPGRVGFIDAPDVLLGRTNAEVVARALLEMAGGRRVCLQGGAKEIIWFAESAMMLMGGGRASHPDLACFGSWDAVLRYVQEDENGADLATLVRIVEQFGAQGIIEGLSASVSAANADVTVSTAHKAKGAEWGSVTLLGDFPDQDPGPAELRLMYVAATRAKNELDATLVDLHGPAVERATDSGL